MFLMRFVLCFIGQPNPYQSLLYCWSVPVFLLLAVPVDNVEVLFVDDSAFRSSSASRTAVSARLVAALGDKCAAA
jgi:hypothetical protein